MDETVKKSARAILSVFKTKNLGAGGFVHFDEFGKTLRWEAGYVKHDNQREALRYLVENGYLLEMNAGLELTRKGADSLKKLR
jgi:thioredoxin-related protein